MGSEIDFHIKEAFKIKKETRSQLFARVLGMTLNSNEDHENIMGSFEVRQFPIASFPSFMKMKDSKIQHYSLVNTNFKIGRLLESTV